MHFGRFARGQPGFTLAETLVVCAIFGLLLTMAFPMYRTTADNVRVRGAAGTLASDIRLAQEYAMRSARPARVRFDAVSNSYDIQVATNPQATSACGDNNYETVKTVRVDANNKVRLADPVVPCLVFESTGRTAWMNPRVPLDAGVSPTPNPSKTGLETYYFNGYELDQPTNARTSEEIVHWSKSTVFEPAIVIDLQRYQHVQSLCVNVIEDRSGTARVAFPVWMKLDWAPSWQGDAPPDEDTWELELQTRAYPYQTIRELPPTWRVSCEPFELGMEVRWLRLRFRTQKLHPTGSFAMALDEIRIDLSSIKLVSDNGRVTRQISVAPITGRVSVQ